MEINRWNLLLAGLIVLGPGIAHSKYRRVDIREWDHPLQLSVNDVTEAENPKIRLTAMELGAFRLAACEKRGTETRGHVVQHKILNHSSGCQQSKDFAAIVEVSRVDHAPQGLVEMSFNINLKTGEILNDLHIVKHQFTSYLSSWFFDQNSATISIKSRSGQALAQKEIAFWAKSLGNEVDGESLVAAEKAVNEGDDGAVVSVEVAPAQTAPSAGVFNPLSNMDATSFGQAADGALH